MSDTLRTFLGSATTDEAVLAGLLFLCIVLFTWAPRAGEAVGRWIAGDDE